MENLFVENDKIMSQADAMPTRESQKQKTMKTMFLNATQKHVKLEKSENLTHSSTMHQLTYVTWLVKCNFATTTARRKKKRKQQIKIHSRSLKEIAINFLYIIHTSKSPKSVSGKFLFYDYLFTHKQPSRRVLKKSCSENMQQIYRRTPMPKCDVNKVVLQFY